MWKPFEIGPSECSRNILRSILGFVLPYWPWYYAFVYRVATGFAFG